MQQAFFPELALGPLLLWGRRRRRKKKKKKRKGGAKEQHFNLTTHL